MDRPDILFLVVDSVRQDRLPLYGHGRPTTPRLDRLADQATVFEKAYAPAPWTLPSHCSMFTGEFPSEHGVTNGFTDRSLELPKRHDTLPERLSNAGYRTAGFSNNPWVGQLSALDRGFDEFVEWDLEISTEDGTGIHDTIDRTYSRLHSVLGTAARQPVFLLKRRFFTSSLVERATDWLETTAGTGDPTFTFLNLMEAHSPYFPPRSAFRDLDLEPPGPIEPRVLNTKLLAYVLGKTDLPPSRREHVLEFYDASLRYQDRKVGELLETLRGLDTFDETLVVVCSDHGKTLGEYDRDVSPPHYVRSINTDVPLVVKAPGQEVGGRSSRPVELTNFPDLMLDGGRTPERTLSADGYALVEDFVPHTGRESTDVTRWRVLSDGTRRYVRSDTDEEFLFADGESIDPGGPVKEELQSALDERVQQLSHARDDQETGDGIDSVVEEQLGDLGYLE